MKKTRCVELTFLALAGGNTFAYIYIYPWWVKTPSQFGLKEEDGRMSRSNGGRWLAEATLKGAGRRQWRRKHIFIARHEIHPTDPAAERLLQLLRSTLHPTFKVFALLLFNLPQVPRGCLCVFGWICIPFLLFLSIGGHHAQVLAEHAWCQSVAYCCWPRLAVDWFLKLVVSHTRPVSLTFKPLLAVCVVIRIWKMFLVYTDMNGYGCAGLSVCM